MRYRERNARHLRAATQPRALRALEEVGAENTSAAVGLTQFGHDPVRLAPASQRFHWAAVAKRRHAGRGRDFRWSVPVGAAHSAGRASSGRPNQTGKHARVERRCDGLDQTAANDMLRRPAVGGGVFAVAVAAEIAACMLPDALHAVSPCRTEDFGNTLLIRNAPSTRPVQSGGRRAPIVGILRRICSSREACVGRGSAHGKSRCTAGRALLLEPALALEFVDLRPCAFQPTVRMADDVGDRAGIASDSGCQQASLRTAYSGWPRRWAARRV